MLARRKITALLMTVMIMATTLAPGITMAQSGFNRNNQPSGYAADRVIVSFSDNLSSAQKNALKAKYSLRTKASLRLTNSEVLQITSGDSVEAVLDGLKREEGIKAAQPDYQYHPASLVPTDSRFNEQWGLDNSQNNIDIDAPQAWGTTQGSSDVIVGVLDTGIDIFHPDLVNSIWVNIGEIPYNNIDDDDNGYVDDVHGWDFYNGHDDNTVYDPQDGEEHGTHIAGIIAASMNNGYGITGVAPNVKIMPVKFIGPDGVGYTSNAIQAMQYAIENGATILNNSWGYQSEDDPTLRNAIEAAGALFITAAGNDGRDNDLTHDVPSGLDSSKVLSVAAVNYSGALAGFSNYGVKSVDVAAPGENILSLKPYNQPLGAGIYASGTGSGGVYKVIHLGFGLEHVSDPAGRSLLLQQLLQTLDTNTSTPILLVDDDGSEEIASLADHQQHFVEALEGYTYSTVYGDNLSGGPTAADMANHTVIWFTGDSTGDSLNGTPTLSEIDRNYLQTFLDGGGRLLLVGDELTFGSNDDPLFTNYLQERVYNYYQEFNQLEDASQVEGIGSLSGTYVLENTLGYQDFLIPTGPDANVILQYTGGTPEQGYQQLSGTSMAAPFVTGIAALLKSVKPSLAPEQMIDIIKKTTTDIPALTNKVSTGGLVNANNALNATSGVFIETIDGRYSPAYSPNSSPQVEVSGVQVGDNVKIFEGGLEVASGVAADTSISLNLTSLSEGQHQLTAQAVDGLNNTTTSIPFTYVVDTAAPQVAAVAPAAYANDVPITSTIDITFNEEMDPSSISESSLYLTEPSQNLILEAAVSYNWISKKAVITPQESLQNTTQYSVYVDGVTDRAGNLLVDSPRSWSFTTAATGGSGGSGGGGGGSTPVSTDPTSSITIDPGQPGTLRSADSSIQVTFQPGAVPANTKATLTAFAASDSNFSTLDGIAKTFGQGAVKSFEVTIGDNGEVLLSKGANISVEIGQSGGEAGLYRYDPIFNTLVPMKSTLQQGLLQAEITYSAKFVVVNEKAKDFKDVNAAHWSKQYIDALATRNIINGDTKGYFAPSETLTREQLAKIISLSANVRGTNTSSSFKDQGSESQWSKAYITSAKSAGLVNGYEDGSFRPNKAVTRAELVKIAVLAAGLEIKDGNKVFQDTSGHWAEKYLAAAKKAGIIEGYKDGSFMPEAPVTREEAAKILATSCGFSKK